MQIEDNVLLRFEGQETIVAIPDGVTKIGDRAFSGPLRINARPIPMERVVFPQSLKQLGDGALLGANQLKEIIFSTGLEVIEQYAFAHCTSLTEIVLPETVHTVFPNVFYRCEALTKAILPHTVSGYAGGKWTDCCISKGLFSRCRALKEVIIPEGTKIIGEEAFKDCVSLTRIHIPESVEEICAHAFDYCVGLREIKLPSHVNKIGCEAFPHGEHSKLERIVVEPENESYCSIDGVLYSKDLKKLVLCPVNYTKTVFAVPEGVEEISSCAFEGCERIRKLILPNSVMKIGEKAFSRMYGLKSVVLPATLNELGKEVFAYCTKLNDVRWPEVSFGIGEGCFRQTGFTDIALPDNVNTIGDYAFVAEVIYKYTLGSKQKWSCCTEPRKVSLPKSVVSVGLSAFYGANEIEVYDTVDSNAEPAEECIESVNGSFNGRLGGVGIYVRDGYLPGACNSVWYDHVIVVRSQVDDSVKYRVRMPDGQKRKVYCTFASAWGKNASFNFKAVDAIFDELTPSARLDYAMDRLRYPEGIEEQFLERLIEYISKRAKTVITKIIERDSLEDLSCFSKFGIIKKRAVNGYVAQAREAGAVQCERWLQTKSDSL